MSNDVPPQIIWDQGCNAAPLDTGHGRCCAKCDMTKVIPERLHYLYHRREIEHKQMNEIEKFLKK